MKQIEVDNFLALICAVNMFLSIFFSNPHGSVGWGVAFLFSLKLIEKR